VRVGFGFIVPAAIAFAAIFLFLGRLALQSQKRPAVTGVEGLIGTQGRARDALTPDAPGYVQVRGELWRATSDRPIAPGQPVRVLDVHGLSLTVEPLTAAGPTNVSDPAGPAAAGHHQRDPTGTHGESS
jgi:membrane-bound serine protease (ClpP class)